MKKLADTISYAITIYVIEILRFNKKFYVVIEDLSPTLNKDISFIRKAYSDALGDLIYEAASAHTAPQKKNRIDEIKNFLKREEGRDKDWIDKILKYFNKCIYGNKIDNNVGRPITRKKLCS